MRTVKSKKISLALLAAVVIADWYVGSHAYDSGANNPPASAEMPRLSSQLPTLRAIQLPPSLASAKFPDIGSGLTSLQEFSAFALTSPLHMALIQSHSRERLEQTNAPAGMDATNVINQTVRDTQTARSRSDNDSSSDYASMADNLPPAAPQSRETHKSQPDSLLKVLALYYMLNR